MPTILPLSEFSNKIDLISKLCHEKKEPIFLTNEGYGDMVIMGQELYEQLKTSADLAVSEEDKEETQSDSNKSKKTDVIEKLPLEDVMNIFKEQVKREKRI